MTRSMSGCMLSNFALSARPMLYCIESAVLNKPDDIARFACRVRVGQNRHDFLAHQSARLRRVMRRAGDAHGGNCAVGKTLFVLHFCRAVQRATLTAQGAPGANTQQRAGIMGVIASSPVPKPKSGEAGQWNYLCRQKYCSVLRGLKARCASARRSRQTAQDGSLFGF